MVLSYELGSGAGVGRLLADAEDHELGGFDHRDADETDEPAVVEVVLVHRAAVAAYEERLLRALTEQRARAPLAEQEAADRLADVGPQRGAVRLEHRPLRADVDRALEVVEVAPHAHVLPLGIGADRARAPHSIAAAREEAQTV